MGLWSLLAWIIIGGLAGWFASMVMKTNSRQGTLEDIVVGIVGAFVGAFVLDFLNLSQGATISGFNLPSLFTAFIGAIIFLGVLRLVRRV